jgi:Abhydrolase family
MQTQYASHQTQRRRELWQLLGDLPQHRTPTARVLGREKHDGFDLERLELQLNGVEPVPAYLLLPHHRPKRAPAMLYLHAHGGTYDLGKEELLRGRDVMKPYATELARRGIVTLAADSWCFAGRKHQPDGRNGEEDTFKHMLWHGQVMWGMMLFDEMQALTYLIDRPEVNPSRVGALGLSMGATKAWWLAALDPRVSVCIDLCCLTDYGELIRTGNLRGHGVYYYVPGLLKHFQSHQINELIAPRPRLSLNGRHDPLAPPAGVKRVRDHVLPLYEQYGRREDCRIELLECGHEETPAMRRLVLEWLDRYLVQAQ